MRFRPCIDLHENKVKQIVGSTLTDAGAGTTNFVSDRGADYYAGLYRDDDLRGGHVIMLGPGNEPSALAALKAWPGGLQLGGGITAENAPRYLDAGAGAVIVTGYVFSGGELDMERLEKLHRAVGRERLVLDLSCKKREDGSYYIMTDRWTRFTRLPVDRETLRKLSDYAFEFLVHAVAVEGKKSGVDSELIGLLAENSSIPAVYAGGIRDLSDVETVRDAGKGRIDFTVGSALDIFGGTLPYRELVGIR